MQRATATLSLLPVETDVSVLPSAISDQAFGFERQINFQSAKEEEFVTKISHRKI